MGVDPAAFRLDVYGDEWYASVSALERFGSVTSPIGWHFGFGAEGRLEYAGGVLARPQEVGPYPLVDLDTAIARLGDGYYGGIFPMATGDAVSMGAPEALCMGDSPCDDELPPTEPQHVRVTLTEARLDLWWVWDSGGTVWLLPAFTFLADDDLQFTIPAVTDQYLVMDNVAVDPGVDEPAPPPADGEDGPPTDVEPVVIGDDEAAALIGLTEDEALAAAAERGWEARVVARDGEGFAVTDDYSTGRVNLTIDAGLVVAVTVG